MAKRLQLGLDTYSYHIAAPVWPPRPPEPLTLEGYLDRAAELGVDGLALADMRHFASTDPRAVGELKSRADRLGLYVELGTGGVDTEHLRCTLRLARQLGGSALRTFVSIGRTWSMADDPRALPQVARALRQAAQACEETGVALAVENHQDLTAPELAELLDRVDHPLVGACWDTGNSLGVLEHPLDGLALLADRTSTVHLKSYAVLPPPADGPRAGYVLVGVPPDHNRDMLRRSIAMLLEASPAESLHINVEAAVEYIPVTPARPGWRAEYAEPAGRILQARGMDAAAGPSGPEAVAQWVPRGEMSLQQLVALEDRLVRESVAQARALLEGYPQFRAK